MIRNKIEKTIIAILIAMSLTTQLAFAHSGRTDSKGGHKDNKNVALFSACRYPASYTLILNSAVLLL